MITREKALEHKKKIEEIREELSDIANDFAGDTGLIAVVLHQSCNEMLNALGAIEALTLIPPNH